MFAADNMTGTFAYTTSIKTKTMRSYAKSSHNAPKAEVEAGEDG